MQTRVLTVDPRAVAEAAAVLRRGGLVAFPTETVYGLGANALDAAAVERIFAAKGRPAHNPLIVHVADPAAVAGVAADWPATAARLAARFWPGPLTLVLPRRPAVPDVVTGGGPTVGVRVPDHPVALALLRAAGLPVAAPSANRSTGLSPTRAEHVLASLDGRVDLVLDGGPTPGGIESTVLDLTVAPPRLLRPGLIDAPTLEAVIGPVQHLTGPMAAHAPLPSPGLQSRHYAPRTTLECVEAGAEEWARNLCGRGRRVGWVARGAEDEGPLPANLVRVVLPPEPAGYAAGLYAALHTLDAAGLDRIVVSLPPDTAEWQAVRDRLRRAAAAEGVDSV